METITYLDHIKIIIDSNNNKDYNELKTTKEGWYSQAIYNSEGKVIVNIEKLGEQVVIQIKEIS